MLRINSIVSYGGRMAWQNLPTPSVIMNVAQFFAMELLNKLESLCRSLAAIRVESRHLQKVKQITFRH